MLRLCRVFVSRQRTCQLLVLLLALGVATTAAAQGERGVIIGTVADAQGGVLPGVSITVRNVDTGFTQTDVTDGSGQYRFGALPLGRYELKAELVGFTTATVTSLAITINREIRQDISMSLSTLTESLVVTGQAPVVEVTKSEVSSVITQQQIEMLPVANRAAVTLALLLPGTSQDGTRPRRSNAQVGAGTLQFTSNSLADGTMNMSTKAGEPRQDFPQAAIQEFKVFTSQAPAEYGGRAGGVINVVTKSGTNVFSGEGYEFLRNKAMNKVDKFTQAAVDAGQGTDRYNRHQFGGALGGPIVMNRVHFFVAAEGTKEDTSYLVNTGRPQFYGKFEGVFDGGLPNRELFARVDGQITPKQSGFVRYAEQRAELICEGCGGRSANAGNTLIPRDALVMGHTWVLGSRFLNEFRFNYAQQHQYQSPSGVQYYKKFDFSPERFVGTTATYNFPSFAYGNDNFFLHHAMIREWRDDFSISASSHNIKFGADIQNNPLHEDAQGNPSGTWTFGIDQPFDPTSAATLATLTGATRFQASFPGLIRYSAAPLLPGLRPGRVEGQLNGDAEPRFALRAGHVDLERKPEERRVVLSASPAICELPESRRRQQRFATSRVRVGCHRRREIGRARRIRSALQYDHERHAGRRRDDAAADEHQHQQSVVSRPVPGTLAGVVRLDRAAEHQHRLRRHGEPVRGHGQRRVLPAARRGHGDQR